MTILRLFDHFVFGFVAGFVFGVLAIARQIRSSNR